MNTISSISDIKRIVSWILSLGIHGIIFGIFYYWCLIIFPSLSSTHIGVKVNMINSPLKSIPKHPLSQKNKPSEKAIQDSPLIEEAISTPIVSSVEKKHAPKTTNSQEKGKVPLKSKTEKKIPTDSDASKLSKQKIEKPSTLTKNASSQHKIDDRAIYNKSSSPKKASAVLELTGWTWDNLPQPNDKSQDTGKIIFEIKVDEMGEVVGVKTLEKTVNASTEKIYRMAIEQLTFSRNEEKKGNHLGISIGKVTFFIRAT